MTFQKGLPMSSNVDFYNYPKQGEFCGMRVRVCFGFESEKLIEGFCLRNDAEQPFMTLIRLSDGRIVTGDECHYERVA